jgi:hypothetical protein
MPLDNDRERIDDLRQLLARHVLPQRQAEHALIEVFCQRQRPERAVEKAALALAHR